MVEIKPRIVEGEWKCDKINCPKFMGSPNELWCDAMKAEVYCRPEQQTCWPYYRAALAERDEEIEQLKKQLYEPLRRDDGYAKAE